MIRFTEMVKRVLTRVMPWYSVRDERAANARARYLSLRSIQQARQMNRLRLDVSRVEHRLKQ